MSMSGSTPSSKRVMIGAPIDPPVTAEELQAMIQRVVDLAGTLEREAEVLLRYASGGQFKATATESHHLLTELNKTAHALRRAAERMPRG